MPVSRPIPKTLLKKAFLKLLHEHRRGGQYEHRGHSYGGIIRELIPRFLGIDRLTREEEGIALRAVFELERDDYIMQDATQSHSEFKILSDRGREVVEQDLDDMQLPSISIDNILTRTDLLEKVRDEYLTRDYETAIFKAFKLIEERVRAVSGQTPSVIGAALMSTAFNPTTGQLSHPDAQTDGERVGFHHLMRGAIMWFKNPGSHRTVGYNDPVEAAQVLAFANLLLDMVDQCQPSP